MITAAQLKGLEINPYARELAQVVIWIGYLQWMIGNGFGWREPVLATLETIELRDALLDRTDPQHPTEAPWPSAHYIIGNPPFLGDKKMRGELGDAYLDDLWRVFRGRVPGGADLVTYFFEKARTQIANKQANRAGLLATTTIRYGANRQVLDRIKSTGDIFVAWDNLPWVLEGASVRIAVVGFDDGSEPSRALNDNLVARINADLSVETDVTGAVRLAENAGIAYLGVQKGGPFDISGDVARSWLALPANPNGRPNSDVVKLRLNGYDVMRRSQDNWIVDFGPSMHEQSAALYEAPFEHVRTHVKPLRDVNPRKTYRERWWLHTEPRPGLRAKLASLERFVVTPAVAKHRVFVWATHVVVPDHKLFVFARDDDYFFGVLQSRTHEVWSLKTASRHGLGNDPAYNVATCFETFPFPWPPGAEPAPDDDPCLAAIAAAAADLDRLRTAWLNPEGALKAELKTRTLTNLYNARPTWLANAHAALDRAVWMAYGWADDPAETTDEAILERLLNLNMQHAARRSSAGHRPPARGSG